MPVTVAIKAVNFHSSYCKCNLTECSLEGLPNAHTPVHLPMSRLLQTQGCYVRHLFQCIRYGSAFPFILLSSIVLWASIGNPVQAAVFCHPHAHGSLVFAAVLSCIWAWFWVVPPPTLPCLFCMYCISIAGALFPLCVGAHGWCQDLPAMGTVSSRSRLPIVEAPGCLGHSTSVWWCCC